MRENKYNGFDCAADAGSGSKAARQRSDSAADTLIGPVLNTWRVSIMI